jgi:hypothetical protein
MVTAPWTVDPVAAREVADAFLAAPTKGSDERLGVAYARLEVEATAWFVRLTSSAVPRPVRVVSTRVEAPYADAAELATAVRSERTLELHSAGFTRDRRHPLLDSTVGGAFDRFRAVHDIVSHGWLGLPFDRDGEFSAWLAEETLYSPVARLALVTELHAQHSVLWTSAQLAELKAVLLPAELVGAARRARRRRGGPAGRATDGTHDLSRPGTAKRTQEGERDEGCRHRWNGPDRLEVGEPAGRARARARRRRPEHGREHADR